MSNGSRLASAEQVVTDRRRRFGFSGGVPNMLMDAKKSGLDCNPIEGGRLLMFVPGKDGYLGGYDPVKKRYPKLYVDMMPADYASLVDRQFHTNEDFGFRLLPMLTALEYTNEKRMTENGAVYDYHDQADAYFNVVHPLLASCPYGLNTKIQTCDPEVGEGELVFQVCPTCQLALLESQETSDRIFNASQTLDSKILLELREALIGAYKAALNHVERKNQMVMSDIARKMTGTQHGRNTLNAIDRIHLKMMHRTENAQANTQIEMMRELGREIAGSLRSPAVVEPVGTVLSPEEVAEYEAYKMRKANMAKAREAKGKQDESNTEVG